MFRSVPRCRVSESNPNPLAAVERAARELLRELADGSTPPALRVAEVDGNVACLVLVWDARDAMPTVGGERRRRDAAGRDGCRADVLAVVRDAGRAVTRKEVVRALRDAGAVHGPSTVAKALADLTAAGELFNPKDKKGYRLAGWKRPETPSLFN